MADQSTSTATDYRVLVHAPGDADAEVIARLLSEAQLTAICCGHFAEVADQVVAGAGAVVVTEEALFADTPELLSERLAEQPAWSDLPLIVIVSPTNDAQWAEVLSNLFGSAGNLTLLERPCRAATLISTVQVALRARRKQYEVRDLLKSEHTAWLRAEASLQQAQRSDAARKLNEERLQLAAQTARLGMWTVTLSNRAVEMTELCRTLLGIDSTAETTAESLRAHVHPDDVATLEQSFERMLRDGEDCELECRVRSDDGQWRWLFVRGHLSISWNGQPVHVTGVMQDITTRKQAEVLRERLLESERAARAEAERVGRMKDEFLATLSHELRTPLNAIMGWIAILRTGRVSSEDQLRGLEVIERNTRLQSNLISDMLDVSRMISGKMRIDVQNVDLVSVIKNAIESVQPTLKAKNLHIDTEYDGVACHTLGDAARLQQIVWNLLSNAVKFTSAGGRIAVGLRRQENAVLLEVSDDGQGIEPAFLPYMFDRFRQADSTNRRSHGGLGLGLSIVRHLTELHGGSVDAHSDGVGRGATFRLRFPLQAALPAAPLPPASALGEDIDSERVFEEATRLDGLHVLVLDDDADALDLAVRILSDSHARVSTATSVAEALEKLREEQPDLVVSDLSMPMRDGFDFARSVRSLTAEQGGKTPLLALSALARGADRELALQCGFDEHLAKPIEPAQLLRACRRFQRRGGESQTAAAARMS